MKLVRRSLVAVLAFLVVASIAGQASAMGDDDPFVDVRITRLYGLSIFNDGPEPTIAAGSFIANRGNVSVSGSTDGADAVFQLRNMSGQVVSRGVKDSFFFECSRFDKGGKKRNRQWNQAGNPTWEGDFGLNPGCVDDYDPSVNNRAQVSVEGVPDGRYFYEVIWDGNNNWAPEPDSLRSDNGARVEVELSTRRNGARRATLVKNSFEIFRP